MTTSGARGTLELSREEMRALGYRVVDLLVEHIATLRDKPVTRRAGRPAMEARLREPVPRAGSDPGAVLAQVETAVLATLMHLDHPRFFAFVPGPSNFVGVMADALAAGFNVFAGTWLEAAGPAQIELVTLDWLRQLCGLPEAAGGLFVSGGSVANLTALAVARRVVLGDRLDGAVVYGSDQTHSSVERGLRLLGFAPAQFRKLPSDAAFRLPLAELRRAVAADRAAGRRPFCVVASAGTTNTGAVDPLPALADFCREAGLWLHADGAYGAAAVLCDAGRARLEGLDRVDSLSLDPHKWLFQPYEIGCVLVRDRRLLRETFRIVPEYLRDLYRGEPEGNSRRRDSESPGTFGRELAPGDSACREPASRRADIENLPGNSPRQGGESIGSSRENLEPINFCDYGLQLSRGFRALKLWMSLKVFGLDAFRRAVERGIALAELAEAAVRRLPGWEVVTPAQLAVVTFRYAPPGMPPAGADALNRRLVEAMVADGFAMVSSTVLRGRTVLRMCAINPRTTDADVEETIRRLDRFAAALSARA